MAKTKISEFSANPANNTDIDSINIAEGCAPSGINDAIRELMAQLKDFQAGTAGDSFNGPIGTTTAAAGAFTTLSASSTVSGTGFSNYLASPPAIGGTAAAAGAFTTLAASGAVTLSGGTANGVTYLNGSKVLTSGSALTFDGSNTRLGVGVASPAYTIDSGGVINTASAVYWGGGVGKLQYGGSDAYIDSTGSTIFRISGSTEQMRLTSTGLGIGTSSPTQKLEVAGNVNITGTGTSFGNGLNLIQSSVSANRWGFVPSGGSLYLGKTTDSWGSNSVVATFDTSGNLGLGVTPSAWSGIGKTLQINTGGAFSADTANAYFSANCYFNGTSWIYQTTNASSRYAAGGDSIHRWYTAPSGTAGNAISFTQAMSLLANGTLCVNTTSSAPGSGAIQVSPKNDVGFGSDAAAAYYSVANYFNGSFAGGLYVTSGVTTLITSSDYRLKNITGPITTSGAYIDSLNPVEGTWKADGSAFVGLIAHEVQEVSKTIVATGTKDGEKMQGMTYSSPEMIANLIAEVKSLRQRVATLEAQ